MTRFATAFPVTYFKTFGAAEKREAKRTLAELYKEIATANASQKGDLPWLKLATFGDLRTDKKSLRHDANVKAVSGIEADYDGEQIPFESAVATMQRAGIAGIVYTSPSHTPQKPRWRVVCPFSQQHPPEARHRHLARLNGAFDGIFADESWTLSQSYYYGSVGGNPAHAVEVIEGEAIDLLDSLDAAAIGKNGTGAAESSPAKDAPFNEAACIEALASGESYHRNIVRLAGKWATDGVAYIEARQRIVSAMEAVPPENRDARWHARFSDIDRGLLDIYGKQAAKRDDAPAEKQKATFPALHLVTAHELLTRDFPPRENVLAPWLPTKGLAMIYGPRGIGKTHLTLGIAYAIASGGSFLRWKAPTPCRVLVIDGEMPASVLQSRLADIVAHATAEAAPDALRFLAMDLQQVSLDLSNLPAQEALEGELRDAEVLILDNISTLASTGRENEAESWLPVQQWALAQRRAGRSVLFIHHAGKGGAQRGTSRREDVLDTVIALRRPADYDPTEGARFEVHYEKARGFHGDDAKPFEAALGAGGWTTRDLADADMARIVMLNGEGMTVREIAEEMGAGWSKSRVQRVIDKARGAGLMGEAGHA